MAWQPELYRPLHPMPQPSGSASKSREQPSRTGTAGWYNIEAFRQEAEKAGLPAWNFNGDAFSEETKTNIIDIIKDKLDTIDFLVYSIAAPRRIDPATGEIYSSVIKPIGKPFTASSVDFLSGIISEVSSRAGNR